MGEARTIFCRSVMTATGWQSDVSLRLDQQGVIQGLGPGTADSAALVLDGPVIPGMPNLHSHAFQRAIAGLTARRGQGGHAEDHFWSWREAMYRTALRISPEQLEVIAGYLFVEMLKAGYTSCAEFHYLHHAPDGQPYDEPAEMSLRILSASSRAGMPLTLLPVLYRWSGFDQAAPQPTQRRFIMDTDAYLGLLEHLRGACDPARQQRFGIAPHSLRAVDAGSLREVLGATDADTPIHIHVAEQPAEVADARVALGTTPVAWLLREFDPDQRWCMVHATHTTAGERQALAATGAVAGICPTTEADLGDGFFETRDWLDQAGNLGIGSDSNLRISPTEELRWLEFCARLRSGRRIVLSDGECGNGRFLWEHAARGGGQALGQPVGQIAPGFRADLLELDHAHPLLSGRQEDTAVDTLVFNGEAGLLKRVLVAGDVQVENGYHPQQEALDAETGRALRALLV